MGTQSKTYGSYVLFTITASSGYHIKDIVVNGKVVYSGVHNTDDVYYLKLRIKGNTTVKATFAKDTYTIEATAGEGGSISPSGEVYVAYGDSITFYITPEDGYRIKDVRVDGESVGAIEEYTFRNVKESHIIGAEFEKKETVIVLRPGDGHYWVNGQMSEMDVAPFIDPRYDRTVVPLRFVAQAMGLSVEWNGDTREISITGYVKGEYTELVIPMRNLKEVKVKMGGKEEYLYESDGTVYIGGEEKNLEKMGLGKPVIYHRRTMVPVRFVAEIFGAKVGWDGETRTIIIKM
ncbi:MAG: copper amine oxidase N-terminal domain-containing protein [Dictyoglomi bacterium]|nr:copper amine oxidase N-terminal domain-containing protein [Dictyoglomota bacterium]